MASCHHYLRILYYAQLFKSLSIEYIGKDGNKVRIRRNTQPHVTEGTVEERNMSAESAETSETNDCKPQSVSSNKRYVIPPTQIVWLIGTVEDIRGGHFFLKTASGTVKVPVSALLNSNDLRPGKTVRAKLMMRQLLKMNY